MKKHLLLGTLLLAAIVGLSQTSRVRIQSSGIHDMKKQKLSALDAGVHEPQMASPLIGSGQLNFPSFGKPSGAITSVSWKLLCGSMNVYGMIINTSRPLQYHPHLNAVSFVHRKSDTYTTNPVLTSGAQSGVVLAEISTDWGTTWDSTAIWADNVQWGRYPQGAIYSPPTNTVLGDAYFVGSGITVSGSNFTGNWYASKRLNTFDNVASTATGAQQFMAFGLSSYPAHLKENGWNRTGFTVTDDGLARSLSIVETDYQGLITVKGFAVSTGSFNGSSFDWRVDTMLPSCILNSTGEKHLNPDPQMAWNQSGTIGYIVGIGALSTSTLANKGYQPIVYKMDRTQSSPTWTLMTGIDFNSSAMRPVVRSKFESRIGLAGMHVLGADTVGVPFVDDFDITVDNLDKLHIGATLMSTATDDPDSLNFISQFTTAINPSEQYKWRHLNGSRPYLYDFIGDGSSPWEYRLIDSMSSEGPSAGLGFAGYNENPWDNAGTNGAKIGMGSRIQLGRTPDGNYITFSWSESDSAFTTNGFKWNNLPDLKVRMLAVANSTAGMYKVDMGPKQNLTKNDAHVAVRATLHYMSPVSGTATVANSTSNHSVDINMPFTVTNSDPYSQATNNTTWYGKGALSFVFDSPIIVGVSNQVSRLATSLIYPNPAKNSAEISLVNNTAGALDIQIINAIGQTVKASKSNINAGENRIQVDLSGLSPGIYFVNLKTTTEKATKKLVIE